MARWPLSESVTLHRSDLKLPAGETVSLLVTVSKAQCLQAELGDVVYVELPEVGTEVEQGETFGVIESVKVCTSLSTVLTSSALCTGIPPT